MPTLDRNDLDPNAAWRSTIYTTVAARQVALGGRDALHPIFSLLGVSIFSVMADFMHIVDLGIAHRIIGSVLFLMCYYGSYIDKPTPGARPFNIIECKYFLVKFGFDRAENELTKPCYKGSDPFNYDAWITY